ncbi:MAG: ATP-binding protein [Coraliomargarita sp.]
MSTILPPWNPNLYILIVSIAGTLTLFLVAPHWWTRRLRKRNAELETMIHQRTSELERSKQQLRQANAVKQDFLANMSHEIRNPLNGILGIARLMRDQTRQSGEEYERLQHLFHCASHLHQLLGEVLDYSSLEAGRLSAKRVSFNPLSLVKQVCAMHRPMAETKGLELSFELPELKYEWIGDPVRLRQILIHLISNAIQYTPSGRIDVRLEHRGESAVFSVSDTGPGIPPEKQPEIFEAFTRLSKAGESQIPGTGLGLAIASQLAVLLGGELTLDPNYKTGARFSLRVRAEPNDHRLLPPTSGHTSNTFSRPFQNMRVLIAEDMGFNRYINSRLMKQLGATTRIADSGHAALRELSNGAYDLALLDINMPDMTGIEVVRSYLETLPVHPPKLIALSAHSTKGMQGDCLKAGFDYFIQKPLEPEKLRQLTPRKTPQKEALTGSLLDYLANQSPEAKQKLELRFRESTMNELAVLQLATEQSDSNAQSASLHKIRGLIAFRQAGELSQAFEALERTINASDAAQDALTAIHNFSILVSDQNEKC